MAVGDAYVFPWFLTPVLTQLFFPKPPTTFLTCFCRGERRKYAGKKSRLIRGSNSQPPGHESDTLTTEPTRRGCLMKETVLWCSNLITQCLALRTLDKKAFPRHCGKRRKSFFFFPDIRYFLQFRQIPI